MLDPDTAMGPQTLPAALRAAGAVVHAVDLVIGGQFQAVFCAVRPPGHHAERDRAMGFCIFNNIAVGAAHAIHAHGLERVAIVDFDVHHGNGTEHIFQDEPRVLFCSSFQHPFYPFTGHETDTPHIVNITLPAGSDGARFRQEVEAHWLHRLHEFKPQLVMISAGFDAHAEDDMSHVRLREADYVWITRELKKVADQYGSGSDRLGAGRAGTTCPRLAAARWRTSTLCPSRVARTARSSCPAQRARPCSRLRARGADAPLSGASCRRARCG